MLRRNPLSSSSSAAATAAAATSCWQWQLMFLGLFYIVMQCDARAVNVSNTWTMPQEGLNVFYRFFRDRISWFEADAVCQFHHANLVTVDNSFQFDATRDLLRELDVNDIVWTGLMRPQSSYRFMWSNSRPLVADTGYWAEALPLMDAPLCAVIDPIRDYRWHALRCGGPETASFLCEMPVPSWADICILKDMPNLTMQYMADTASIELIRNCQEEGLLRTMCRGKQDRERALQDLICPRERLEAQRINDITNSHFKSLQIINSIPSDNNENNDIELLPMDVNYGPHYPEELQTEKNTVQRLIEQFNVDELMQADEPANMETASSFYKIPGLIPKPVKKSAKKVVEYPKKDMGKQKAVMQGQEKDKNRLALEMDDMMLGDQPQGEPEIPEQTLNEEVSNEIMEPLPHIKKTNIHKEAMEKMEMEAIAMKENMQKSKEIEAKKMAMASSTTTTTTEAATSTTTMSTSTSTTTTTTTPEPSTSTTTTEGTTTTTSSTTTKEADSTTRQHHEESTSEVELSSVHSSSSTTPPATIGHPMHPQQPRGSVITEETQHPHVKESADNSHFIPPMLLVKSHYVPPANKHGHNEHAHAHAEHLETAANEDLAQTTKTHPQSSDMPMTTPKVIDLEATTLKASDTRHNGKQQQQIATESAAVMAEEQTTENGNMKPITQHQHKQEQELHTNSESKIMNSEETVVAAATTTSATMPATTTTSQSSSMPHTTRQDTTLQTTATKLAERTRNANDDNGDDAPTEGEAFTNVETEVATKTLPTHDSKPHTDIAAETTPTAKLVEDTTTPKIVPVVSSSSSSAEAAVETAEEKKLALVTETTQAATTMGHMETDKGTPPTKSDLTLGQPEITKEPQQQKTDEQTTEQAAETTTATATTTTTRGSPVKILATDIQTTQTEASDEPKQQQQQQQHKEVLTEETDGAADKQEAIVKTRDMTTAKATPPTTLTPSQHSTTLQNTISTTATAVKPTTEIKENNTNIPTVGETSTATTTTITTTTTAPSSTPSPASTSFADSSSTTSTTTTTTTAFPPSSTPETTRNFLKVTTEMPYKPNRRRSLTKPDTVSYMKKILG